MPKRKKIHDQIDFVTFDPTPLNTFLHVTMCPIKNVGKHKTPHKHTFMSLKKILK